LTESLASRKQTRQSTVWQVGAEGPRQDLRDGFVKRSVRVKLPKARELLAAKGAGERFEANRGRPMKEWLEVRSESAEEWLQLAL